MTDYPAPPNDHDAERAALGAAMLSESACLTVLDGLTPEDFYSPHHRAVRQAMTALTLEGEPVDAITVSAHLEAKGTLERHGGASYVHGLVDEVPSTAAIASYVGIVARCALRRRLADAGMAIAHSASAAGEDDDPLAAASSIFFEATNGSRSKRAVGIGSLTAAAYAEAEKAHEDGTTTVGQPTHIIALDEILGGMGKGDLILIAARPSAGKTTLAVQIALETARLGSPVLIFSLEMTGAQLAQRILASEASLDLMDIRRGRLASMDDWAGLSAAASATRDMPLEVDDSGGLSVADIAVRSRHAFAGREAGLVVVDYVQLAHGSARAENRTQELAQISGGLKALAKELDCPVLALSQLNRNADARAQKRPQLSDLRDSGALEQDADVVVFLHPTEEALQAERSAPRPTTAIVAKHRNGPIGDAELIFECAYTRFKSASTGQGESWTDI